MLSWTHLGLEGLSAGRVYGVISFGDCSELGSDAPKIIDNLVDEYFSIAHQPYLQTPPKREPRRL